jgi:hypothetical protein
MRNNLIEKTSEKIFVALGSSIDYSRWESFSTNARIQELSKPDNLVYFEIYSLKEATELVEKFIKEYNLGSTNWMGGRVVNEKYDFIANISYNGRIWDNEDWKFAKEIEVC